MDQIPNYGKGTGLTFAAMKIALLGYGNMGQLIEKMATAEGDEVVLIVDETNRASVTTTDLTAADVVIDFTRPEAAVANIELALAAGVPVVVGTTGWLNELPRVRQRVATSGGALFWASNFSIGVNVFFATAARAAELVDRYGGYAPAVEEIHHEGKRDAPSGTAITLAERVAEQLAAYDSWRLGEVATAVPQTHIAPASAPAAGKEPVTINSVREPGVPGTHVLTFRSEIDTLEVRHTAHSRAGFARGALVAARWLVGKRGTFTMTDLLGI